MAFTNSCSIVNASRQDGFHHLPGQARKQRPQFAAHRHYPSPAPFTIGSGAHNSSVPVNAIRQEAT